MSETTDNPVNATILIIDDDDLLRDTIQTLLESYNYGVIAAKDGISGIALARQEKPDLILSDVGMPNLNGYEVFEKLQEDEKTQSIPFIFLTARNTTDDIRRGMSLGADDFITKPFDAEDLLNAIQVRLHRQRVNERKMEDTLTLLRKSITYVLPHELRTPLTSILGYGALLELDYETIEPETIREYAREIVKGGRRLHRVIENYLAYAQLEAIASNPGEIEALRRHLILVDKVIEKYATEIIQKNNRSDDMTLDLAPNLGLRMSQENLGKVIAELVDNSCKFSAPSTPIKIEASRQDNNLIIKVHDKGRGMSEEDIANIGAYLQFERGIYEQQGLGLGLAIALKLVEVHNGIVQIDSQPEVGTTINISFKMY